MIFSILSLANSQTSRRLRCQPFLFRACLACLSRHCPDRQPVLFLCDFCTPLITKVPSSLHVVEVTRLSFTSLINLCLQVLQVGRRSTSLQAQWVLRRGAVTWDGGRDCAFLVGCLKLIGNLHHLVSVLVLTVKRIGNHFLNVTRAQPDSFTRCNRLFLGRSLRWWNAALLKCFVVYIGLKVTTKSCQGVTVWALLKLILIQQLLVSARKGLCWEGSSRWPLIWSLLATKLQWVGLARGAWRPLRGLVRAFLSRMNWALDARISVRRSLRLKFANILKRFLSSSRVEIDVCLRDLLLLRLFDCCGLFGRSVIRSGGRVAFRVTVFIELWSVLTARNQALLRRNQLQLLVYLELGWVLIRQLMYSARRVLRKIPVLQSLCTLLYFVFLCWLLKWARCGPIHCPQTVISCL